MKKIVWLVVAALLVLTLGVAGCAPAESGNDGSASVAPAASTDAAAPAEGSSAAENTGARPPKNGDKYVIGTVLISGTNPHCQIFEKSFRETVEAKGGTPVVLDADYDPAKLMSCISDLIAQDVDGIVIEACDAEAPVTGIKEAHDKGIVVAATDLIVNVSEDDGTLISMTGTDNYAAGYACGEDFAKRAGDEEKNFVIMDMKTNSSAVERVKGFMDAIKDHPNLKLLDQQQPTPETQEQKMALMDSWIQKFDKIDCVFAFHDPAAIACMQALEAAGRLDGTLIYSVDGNQDAIQAIADGKITATAKQQPDQLAAQPVEDVFKVLNGEEIGHDWLTLLPTIYVEQSNAADYLEK